MEDSSDSIAGTLEAPISSRQRENGKDMRMQTASYPGNKTIQIQQAEATLPAAGEGVTGWRVGEHVTVMPLDWCNECPACLAGNQHICQNLNFVGIDSPGSLQNRWNVRADLLVALPAELRLDHAALVAPTAVAVAVADLGFTVVDPGASGSGGVGDGVDRRRRRRRLRGVWLRRRCARANRPREGARPADRRGDPLRPATDQFAPSLLARTDHNRRTRVPAYRLREGGGE